MEPAITHVIANSNISTIKIFGNNRSNTEQLLEYVYIKNPEIFHIKTWIIDNWELLNAFYVYGKFLDNVKLIVNTYDYTNIYLLKNYQYMFYSFCDLEIHYYCNYGIPDKIENRVKYFVELTSKNIDFWKKYYKSWNDLGITPIYIENHSASWTEDKIDIYCEFIKLLFKSQFKKYFFTFLNNNNLDILTFKNVELPQIHSTLTIDTNTLNIVPCNNHPIVIGYLDQNNNLRDSAIEIGIALWQTDLRQVPRCINCDFASCCSFPNPLISYNVYREIFAPIEEICILEKRKIRTLYELYKKTGLLWLGKKKKIFSNEQLELFKTFNNVII